MFKGYTKIVSEWNDNGSKVSNLTVLSLTYNELERLPDSIGNLTNLMKLEIGGSNLSPEAL